MSARAPLDWARTGFRRCVLAVGLALGAPPAFALDVAAPFVDPLDTVPTVITSGASLPGGGRLPPCPVNKDFAQALALAEAVDIALCNNPQIKAAWAGIKVQAGALGEAKAAYLPTLSVSTSRLETLTEYRGKTPGTAVNGQTVYATLAWRLFDFGGREANREAANHLLVSAIASHEAALQKVLAAVIQAYFDAHTAQAALAAKGQNEGIAQGTLDAAQRKEQGGLVSRNDTLQAATALAKAALEKNRAQGDYRKALSVLAYALAVPQQTNIVLDDDLRDKQAEAARGLENWLELAQAAHPAIKAAREKLESAKQKIASARAEGLPTLDLTANYYQNGYPNQGLSPTISQVGSVGVTLTVPIFDGFARTYKVRGAQAQAEQQEAQLQDTENDILMGIVKTHADAVSSLQNLGASEDLLAIAEASQQSSQRRYEMGAADILETLNTQKALSDARQERVRSLAEWRSARLRLLAGAGLLGRDSLLP
jgi:outer membrane protein